MVKIYYKLSHVVFITFSHFYSFTSLIFISINSCGGYHEALIINGVLDWKGRIYEALEK